MWSGDAFTPLHRDILIIMDDPSVVMHRDNVVKEPQASRQVGKPEIARWLSVYRTVRGRKQGTVEGGATSPMTTQHPSYIVQPVLHLLRHIRKQR